MKRIAILTSVVTGLWLSASAQTPLPYSSNFDNTAQKAGWQAFRKGYNSVHSWKYLSEAPDGAIVPPSAPDCLFHQYPMDGVETQLTNDWSVSPSLNLSTGAKVSFKINVYSIMGLQAGDSIQLYLLKGSADPATATGKVLLANLIGLHSSANHNFRDTNNIVVPPTTGQAYLAFHYTSYQNWFTAAVDNFNVKATTTSIDETVMDRASWKIYPNPVQQTLHWEYTGKEKLVSDEGQIIDITGKVRAAFSIKEQKHDLQQLAPGMYFLKYGKGMMPFIKQ
ncbi:T9SS-dependent choice-of-anchor J family protein [Taibaiella koreensis]|uniref:T9SS-dependent choice-of-anchor J family protein n=1 Tax=Taibaiella koreensis TaxID=1268548 RepID=UPI000E59B64F|nr:T9SS type A sorting domain-containing protein [Taibaiella koreensis]